MLFSEARVCQRNLLVGLLYYFDDRRAFRKPCYDDREVYVTSFFRDSQTSRIEKTVKESLRLLHGRRTILFATVRPTL